MTPFDENNFQRRQENKFDGPRDNARKEKDNVSHGSRNVRRDGEGTDVRNAGLITEQDRLNNLDPKYSPGQFEDKRDSPLDQDKVSGPSPDQLGFGTGKGFVQEGSDFGRQQRQAHADQEQNRKLL